MIGSISRIIEERAFRTAPAVADPATSLSFRRPGPNITFGPGATPSNDYGGVQLDAFRGTIYAAVDKIARRVAQMPVHLFQNQVSGDELPQKTELHSHPFLTLLSPYNGRKPHEDFSVWELDYVTQTSLDLTGECFWVIERDDFGKPSRITPLPTNRVRIILDAESGSIAGYLFVPKGQTEYQGIFIKKYQMDMLRQPGFLTKPFIVHHKYPSPTGIEDTRGWSPVKAAAHAYDINLFEQIYKSNFLQQGAQLGGIMQSDVALSKDQIEEYLDQFESRHQGVRKAGLPIILPKMLHWTTTEPTPRDLQWVEAIGVTESQMLQIYGISDAKLGRADIGNRSTAEAMDVTFNREVIQSRLDVKVHKLNSDFLPIYPGQTDFLFFSAQFDDPVPADNEAALKQENQDITNGVITRNEVRKKRKLQPMGKWGEVAVAQQQDVFIDTAAGNIQNQMEPGAMEEHEAEQTALAADTAAKLKQNTDPAGATTPPDKNKKKAIRAGLLESIYATLISYIDNEDADRSMVDALTGSVSDVVSSEIDDSQALVGGNVDREAIIGEYLDTLAFQVRGVNDATALQIRDVVRQGIADGDSIEEIAAVIRGLFDFADRVRSTAIARTTVLGAMNFAANSTFRAANVAEKEWVAEMDDRTRDSHAEANGQVVPTDAKFRVGESEMEYPGDSNAPASEVINCRCKVIPAGQRSSESRAAMWRAFDKRMTHAESEIRSIVRAEFEKQKTELLDRLSGKSA